MYVTEISASTQPEIEQGRLSQFGELYIAATKRTQNLKQKQKDVHVHKFGVINFSNESSESRECERYSNEKKQLTKNIKQYFK